ELAYNWGVDGEDVFGTNLMQENEELEGFYCTNFSQISGLPPRLICTPKVYSLPSLNQLHSFTDIDCFFSNCKIERHLFPSGGEHYIVQRYWSDALYLFDGNFNELRMITPPPVSNQSVYNFTQHLFNDDDLLEVNGVRSTPADANGNAYLFQAGQETGAVLFSRTCQTGYVSSPDGLPALILIHRFNAPGNLVTEVYDARSFALLHTIPEKADRIVPNGTRDYYVSLPKPDQTVTVYDGTTLVPKVVNTGFPASQIFSTIRYERNRFYTDGTLELYFSIRQDDGSFKVIWMDENGNLLHTFEGAHLAKIDTQEGMQDKLLVYYRDSTQVYSINGTGTNVGAPPDHALLVSPNPFTNYLQVEWPSEDAHTLQVCDVLGNVVLTQTISGKKSITLREMQQMPAGIYLLSINGVRGHHTAKLLKQ
ncbi:MAG: T9SS type A sorting domain-containing protein, partial [Saprospiraceae bacterium]|nr:T9SS type A sorting domain-containing protein [Saprospiraceae bacterium]